MIMLLIPILPHFYGGVSELNVWPGSLSCTLCWDSALAATALLILYTRRRIVVQSCLVPVDSIFASWEISSQFSLWLVAVSHPVYLLGIRRDVGIDILYSMDSHHCHSPEKIERDAGYYVLSCSQFVEKRHAPTKYTCTRIAVLLLSNKSYCFRESEHMHNVMVVAVVVGLWK